MGTIVTFDLYDEDEPSESVLSLLREAIDVLHQADDDFSTYKYDSPLSRLRRGDVTMEQCPADVGQVLELCNVAKNITDGWFDPWSLPGGVDKCASDPASAKHVEGTLRGPAFDVARGVHAAGKRPGVEPTVGDVLRHVAQFQHLADVCRALLHGDVASPEPRQGAVVLVGAEVIVGLVQYVNRFAQKRQHTLRRFVLVVKIERHDRACLLYTSDAAD